MHIQISIYHVFKIILQVSFYIILQVSFYDPYKEQPVHFCVKIKATALPQAVLLFTC